jgi:hypothetical protein
MVTTTVVNKQAKPSRWRRLGLACSEGTIWAAWLAKRLIFEVELGSAWSAWLFDV